MTKTKVKMARTHVLVRLTVPYGVAPGQAIQAIAPGGIKFTTYIPAGLRPGQVFTVRVPTNMSSGAELKDAATNSVFLSLVPTMSLGNDKYIRDVQTCSERCCDMDGCCGAWARYTTGKKELKYRQPCVALACCCDWEASLDGKKVGSIQPAGCCDNPIFACMCPACYCGDLFALKFLDSSGSFKFSTRRNVQCCQYCCLCCSFFTTPCARQYRYCCTDDIFAVYEHSIFNADLNDQTAVAKINYTTRMVHPCIGDELLNVSVEPAGDLSEEDLALLSLATFMISEGRSFEFCMATGAVMGALDTPTGIESLDEAAFISGEWQNRTEALKKMQSMF